MNEEKDYVEIDLLELLSVVRKNILSIILIALIFTGVTGAYNFFIATPKYESESKLFILGSSTSITSLADIQVGSSLTNDYRELIMGRPVLNQVKKNLNLDYSFKEMQDIVSVNTPSDTRIVSITVVTDDPEKSRDIANQVATVSRGHISHIMDTDAPSIAEKAVAAKKPIKPEKAKNMILGLIVGFIFGCGLYIVKHLLNDFISTKDDVDNILGLTVLAEIPVEEELSKKSKKNKKSRR